MLRQANEPLLQHNTLALHASAKAFVQVESSSELKQQLIWARQQQMPVIPLGQGSNIVLAGDLNALVLQQCSAGIELLERDEHSVVLRVEAGHNWHRLVRYTLDQGFYGLENLALIPGTVGAAPIQNIGAYGVEFDQFVVQVHAVRIEDGSPLSLSAAQCEFAYRDSVFKHALRDKLIITAVDIKLSTQPKTNAKYPALLAELEQLEGGAAKPDDIFQAVVRVRSRKLPDPKQQPNAGSFFKNPIVSDVKAKALKRIWPELPYYPQTGGQVKLAAAWLIETAGFKGKRWQGVGVHPNHALVLVNYSAESGEVLLDFAKQISDDIDQRFGVELEIEPRIYGTL